MFIYSNFTHIHLQDQSAVKFAVKTRSLDPSKDLAAYGYGSVAWKERMENWKQKQEDKLLIMESVNNGKDWDNNGMDLDLPL